MIFERLNPGFQLGGERGALADSSSPRGVWYVDMGSRLWVGI